MDFSTLIVFNAHWTAGIAVDTRDLLIHLVLFREVEVYHGFFLYFAGLSFSFGGAHLGPHCMVYDNNVDI